MGRYFLLTYPSLWGMGSDTDIYMVSEKKLRDLIEFEVTQLREGDRFASERLTGTWSDEKFCDSNDMDRSARLLTEAEANLEKLVHLDNCEDRYYESYYDYWPEGWFLTDTIAQIRKDRSKLDHTKLVYGYPISTREFGTIWRVMEDDNSSILTYRFCDSNKAFSNFFDWYRITASVSAIVYV